MQESGPHHPNVLRIAGAYNGVLAAMSVALQLISDASEPWGGFVLTNCSKRHPTCADGSSGCDGELPGHGAAEGCGRARGAGQADAPGAAGAASCACPAKRSVKHIRFHRVLGSFILERRAAASRWVRIKIAQDLDLARRRSRWYVARPAGTNVSYHRVSLQPLHLPP